jgi:hypothetical protein
MENFKEKFQKMLIDRKMTIDQFAKQIHRSKQKLYNDFSRNNIWVRDLEIISKEGQVPMSYWWSDEITSMVKDSGENHHAYLQERIQDLKNERDDLRKHIALLEEKLEAYEGKKKATG